MDSFSFAISSTICENTCARERERVRDAVECFVFTACKFMQFEYIVMHGNVCSSFLLVSG